MKRHILQVTVLVMIMLLPAILHAQPGFGDDVDDVPVDGGLCLLVAAAIGYGAQKLGRSRIKTE